MTEAQKTLYYIAENMKMDKSISEKGYRHFQMAIKALEQEPKTDVLDKIKDELFELYNDRPSNYNHQQRKEFFIKTIKIIDKYKGDKE